MSAFVTFLRLVAPVFVLAGALHLVLGLRADAMLGASVPVEAMADPGLDSQNRFYGVSFMLYGILLFLCASNIAKYSAVLRCVLWVFFAGGLARLVSIAVHGMPPPLIIALLLTELVIPPLVLWWLSRVQSGT